MINASLSLLHRLLPNSTLQQDVTFSGITTDSRHIQKSNLFIALRGEHFDGHNFVNEVMSKQAAAVIVDTPPENKNIPALITPDTKAALAIIAEYWRSQFSLPIIAVTGSNGKTTVKEMIANILRCAYGDPHYLATQGNLNNDIGVPLTLLRLENTHRAAVIELGMNHPGEIDLLAKITKANVAIVNNAQREHQEFMQSIKAVAEENGQVIRHLPNNGVAVFPNDDTYTALWENYTQERKERKSFTFGLNSKANVSADYTLHAFGSDITIHTPSTHIEIALSAAGLHNVRNALAATAATLSIGISPDAIQKGLNTFEPVKGRLQKKVLHQGATLIDDTYNANPDSVRAAIDVLAYANSPRIFILGDMGEVGDEGVAFHQEIGTYAKQKGIDVLLTIGDLAQHATDSFGQGAIHMNDRHTLHEMLTSYITPQSTLLIKGSRFMKMEFTVNYLLQESFYIKEY
jgi:UDP-N-acetylmuramoyl-tripeptide--D-alanyl-D-alanine ligase